MPPSRFTGAVLAGGASRRMGQDKAFVEVGGRPLVRIAADALAAAGAVEVFAVGGAADRLRRAGVDPRPDLHPGEGPLGGVLTALREAAHPIVVVLTCDLPAVEADTVQALVGALESAPDAAVAAALDGGRPQFLTAAYRRAAAGEGVASAFAAGERAVRRAVAGLRWVPVPGLDPAQLRDVDTRADLAALRRIPSRCPTRGA